MGFINEMVSKDDKMEFYIPDYKSVTPSFWTIDRAKGVILFKYWTNIDNPHENLFALIYNQTIIKIVLSYVFCNENTIRWNLIKITIPNEYEGKRKDILNVLREAIKVYGVSGYKFPVPNAIPKPSTVVIVNF